MVFPFTRSTLGRRPLRPLSFVLRALALATLLAFAPATFAEAPLPGADVASVRAWLIAKNPDLRAMQAEAEAAQARIYPAGALPNPMAAIELREIDPDRPTLLPSNVGSTTYSLKQPIPLWGKRGLAREIAGQQAHAAQLEREATALNLLAQAEQAYVRYWHARESVLVVDRLIELLGQVEEVARVRVALQPQRPESGRLPCAGRARPGALAGDPRGQRAAPPPRSRRRPGPGAAALLASTYCASCQSLADLIPDR